MAEVPLVGAWSAETPPLPGSWFPEQLLRDGSLEIDECIAFMRDGFGEFWRDDFVNPIRSQFAAFMRGGESKDDEPLRFILFPFKFPMAAEASVRLGQRVPQGEVLGLPQVEVVKSRTLGAGIVVGANQRDELGVVHSQRKVLFTNDEISVVLELGPAPMPMIVGGSIGLSMLAQGTIVQNTGTNEQFKGSELYGYLPNDDDPFDPVSLTFDDDSLPFQGTDLELFDSGSMHG